MSATIVTVTPDQLEAERAKILRRLEITAEEIARRAEEYTLTAEQAEKWGRLRQIAFLLGDR